MEQELPAHRSALKNLWLVARKRHEMGHERSVIPWTRYTVIEITRHQSEGNPPISLVVEKTEIFDASV